ncbi:peptidase M3A and M3B domain-containing protein [Tieghemostelium lacteum]|uniref:Peptidase M3A and M3B domain-containing protein n=1 Tax=Tieghemostelium lacteum TaxID=361077 RepID=A0A151ZB62_TIELA|nr:peptidase M3A and M3B domain-containing protein [Tieghemostelium lacteum]|eukprot:KYQ91187.1 peptidase M3A and M3B domain-containing protein [Tieghemostelium lacteum]
MLKVLLSKNVLLLNNQIYKVTLKRCYSSSSSSNSCGLFGVGTLQGANWDRLCREKEENINEICRDVTSKDIRNVKDLKYIAHKIDQISQDICTVTDTSQYAINVFRNSSNSLNKLHFEQAYKSLQTFGGIVHRLNADVPLFDKLKQTQQHQLFSQLPFDYQRNINETVKESEQNGINLPLDQRNNLIRYKEGIDYLGSQLDHLYNGNDTGDDLPQLKNVPESALVDLPSEFMQYCQKQVNGKFTLKLYSFMANGILRYSHDSEIREKVYNLTNSNKSGTLIAQTLSGIITQRNLMANQLGYRDFAQYDLSTKLMKTPESVSEFLWNLSTRTKEQSDKELDLMIKVNNGQPIKMSDHAYLKNQILSQYADVTGQLNQYFSYENVFQGLDIFCQDLFGLTFRRVPMEEGECGYNEDDIIKMELHSPTEGTLGYCYIDLWSTPNRPKSSNNTLSIQLGCIKSEFIDFSEKPQQGHKKSLDLTHYQIPRVGMSCDWSRSHTISYDQVLVLFHEFGHCLNILLSRCNFQNLCGTRGPIDFVEIPSSLMECFMRYYPFISKFARDSQGRTLPQDLFDQYLQNHNLFRGINTQEQICLALFCLNVYNHNFPNTNQSLEKLMQKYYNEILGYTGEIGNQFLSKLPHLYYYGPSYYCYLLDQHYADQIWKNLFDSGKNISLQSGNFWRKNFLELGASCDLDTVLNKFIKSN